MQSGTVQKIFIDHYGQYRKKYILSPEQRHAAMSIMTCKTESRGFHVNVCPNGDFRKEIYNSCKHRACPRCGGTDTQLWLERRKAQALDCSYFHVVFTISHDLHIIWRYNRKLFVNLMMRGAWYSLRELLLDWRHLGALVGAIAAFQSWDDDMKEHCHIHFIVTAGGINEDDRWVSAKNNFLLPTHVLTDKFRGKFLAYLKEGFSMSSPSGKQKPLDQVLRPPKGMTQQQCLNLLNKLGRKRWHADIEPAYEHANGVLKYLGRYIRRGPLSERRIVGYDGRAVTIAYAHPDKHDSQTFKLTAIDFMRRVLSHVPAKGSHLVRTYGLFHSNYRKKLDAARKHLGQPVYAPILEIPDVLTLLGKMFPDQKLDRCPYCNARLRIVFIDHGGQASGQKLAA